MVLQSRTPHNSEIYMPQHIVRSNACMLPEHPAQSVCLCQRPPDTCTVCNGAYHSPCTPLQGWMLQASPVCAPAGTDAVAAVQEARLIVLKLT